MLARSVRAFSSHDLARIRQAWERYKQAAAAVGTGGNIYLEGRKQDAIRELDSIFAELAVRAQ